MDDINNWADIVIDLGKVKAAVAPYKDMPLPRQTELNDFLVKQYSKKVLIPELLEAAEILVASNILPEWGVIDKEENEKFKLWSVLLHFGGFVPSVRPPEDIHTKVIEPFLELERYRGAMLLRDREPDDVIVLVYYQSDLIATYTIYPFTERDQIPSLAYLNLEDYLFRLPKKVRAIEIGRLAKLEYGLTPGSDRDKAKAIAKSVPLAFLIGSQYIRKHGLVADDDSYVCGDTYGSLVDALAKFFPLEIIWTDLNPVMMDIRSKQRGLAIHFIERYILGSFANNEQFLVTLENICYGSEFMAKRLINRLKKGFKKLGINYLDEFDPAKFRVYFFHYLFNHELTQKSFRFFERLLTRK